MEAADRLSHMLASAAIAPYEVSEVTTYAWHQSGKRRAGISRTITTDETYIVMRPVADLASKTES